MEFKAKGNKSYQSKRFTEAVDLYSQAIDYEKAAIYYSNRAACA